MERICGCPSLARGCRSPILGDWAGIRTRWVGILQVPLQQQQLIDGVIYCAQWIEKGQARVG